MRQFFKYVFATFTGIMIFFLCIVVLGGLIASVAGNLAKEEAISDNSILHLTLDGQLPDKTDNVQQDKFSFEMESIPGVFAITDALEQAKTDDKVKGIFLEVQNLQAGFAVSRTLREAIEDFKSSGKPVIAFSKGYSQNAYYVSSVADEIYVNPIGMVDFKGFSSNLMYFKDMLDHLGIDMQVTYVGNFKSATEPFRRTDMSEANRLQVREFMDDYFELFVNDVAASRNMSAEQVRQIADDYAALNPMNAAKIGMVDGTAYYDEVISKLKAAVGYGDDDKLSLVNVNKYIKTLPSKYKRGNDRIAVVYLEGSIEAGESNGGTIGDDTYMEILRDIRKKDKYKAVVLRVNSPGGSALASDNIWREIELIKEAGKPVVVSMGTYAASGGYYISCNADTIVAEPATLTGSIGVFNMLPNVQKFANEKMKVHFDSVKTSKMATAFLPFYEMSEEEQAVIQDYTNTIYDVFLERVREGRGMATIEDVHEVAQGRVWTGRKALEIGLVDKLGTLDDAIEVAANMIQTDDFNIKEFPVAKDPMIRLIEDITGKKAAAKMSKTIIKEELGNYAFLYDQWTELKGMQGVQMRLPFVLTNQ